MRFSSITKSYGYELPFYFFEKELAFDTYFFVVDDYFKEYSLANGLSIWNYYVKNLKYLLAYHREKILVIKEGESVIVPIFFFDQGMAGILVKALDNEKIYTCIVSTNSDDWSCMYPSLFYLENIVPSRKIFVLTPEDVSETLPKYEMSKTEFLTAYDEMVASIE